MGWIYPLAAGLEGKIGRFHLRGIKTNEIWIAGAVKFQILCTCSMASPTSLHAPRNKACTRPAEVELIIHFFRGGIGVQLHGDRSSRNSKGQIGWMVLGIVVPVCLGSTGERSDKRHSVRRCPSVKLSGKDREMHGNGFEWAPPLPIAELSGTELLLKMEVQFTSDGIGLLPRLPPIPQRLAGNVRAK